MAFRYIKNPEERIKFAAILTESIADAVIGTEVNNDVYHIVSWNRGAEKLYGWKGEEVIGKPATDIIPSNMTVEQRKKMIADLRLNGSWNGEVIQHNKNGQA